MKVITIKQPWASLIVNGYKKYEFRSWKTNYRGRLYIHADNGIDKEYLEKFKDLNLEYPKGYIIGYVDLDECILLNSEVEKDIINENPLVYGHHTGRTGYAWKINNPNKIKPIEVKGKLGLWNYEKDQSND